ncbi:hypothetical protein [Ruegeria arenilitoris]|uniref:hypothetical protein n=1 Tax=Ruegeria arenilitoris TaxID=1173585 RepID=UPI00147E546C|nr:hypothetical protein [Ruegeria arenilitoris]
MRFLRISGAVVLLLLPTLAQAVGIGFAVRPGYRATVTQLKNGNYQVATHGSSAAIAYWCGIGDFAIRTLRLPTNQRIYVAKAYDKQTRTVQFSLTPPEGGDTSKSYSISVSRVGENMSASGAQSHCFDNIMDFDF